MLQRSDDLDLHHARGQGRDLLLHPVGDAWARSGLTRQHRVDIQVLPDADVTLHDEVECGLMDTAGLHTQEGGLEECLWTPEPLIADGDHLPARQPIALLQGGRGCHGGHLLLEVHGSIAELLLCVSHHFPFVVVVKLWPEVVSQVLASQAQMQMVWERA